MRNHNEWLRPLFVIDGVWETGRFIDPNIAGKAYDEMKIYFGGRGTLSGVGSCTDQHCASRPRLHRRGFGVLGG